MDNGLYRIYREIDFPLLNFDNRVKYAKRHLKDIVKYPNTALANRLVGYITDDDGLKAIREGSKKTTHVLIAHRNLFNTNKMFWRNYHLHIQKGNSIVATFCGKKFIYIKGEGKMIMLDKLLIIIGIVVSVWAFYAPYRRQQKQATIEFYQEISMCSLELRKELRKHNTIKSEDDVGELQKCITDYLSLMERFSVGINFKVYNFKVFCRMAGRATIKQWDKLYPVIKSRRTKNERTYLFTDFERLVKKLRKAYKTVSI
jgi:DNA-binding transcriptional MerR regulator